MPGLRSGKRSHSLGAAAVSSQAALLRQMSPGKARDAANGDSLTKSRNAAWRHLPRNPKGRAGFLRDAALLVVHLESPNFSPLALPRAKIGTGAAADETATALGTA